MIGQGRVAMPVSRENPDPAASSDEVRLSVRGLTKAFHGLAAIENIDFTVSRHEFVAVLGPSGAGKTTLFRCIVGLLAADRGTVRIGRSDVTSPVTGRLREVAVIFQQFNLVNRLTALENVLAGRLGYVPAWRGWLRRFDRSDRLLAPSIAWACWRSRRAVPIRCRADNSSGLRSPVRSRNDQLSLSPMSR